MIQVEHSIELPGDPARAFALLADLRQTPRWLARCESVVALDHGPLGVGTRLRYAYREGRHTGFMDGQVTRYAPGERLTLWYADRALEVEVDFRLAPAPAGARLTHALAVAPKSLMTRLFAPLIRRGLPGQARDAMEALRALLAGD